MDDFKIEKMQERLLRRFRFGSSEEEEAAFIAMRLETDKFIDLPITEWPEFNMQWDLDPEHYHWALDGRDPESFAEDYPEGAEIISVNFEILDSRLIRASSQQPHEFWDVGNAPPKARLIWEMSLGKSVTPALIKIYDDNLSLYIAGGNHRLAVARAKGLKEVPILIITSEKARLLEILDPEF